MTLDIKIILAEDPLWVVKSMDLKGVYHGYTIIRHEGGNLLRCNCYAGQHMKHCKHVKLVATTLSADEELLNQ